MGVDLYNYNNVTIDLKTSFKYESVEDVLNKINGSKKMYPHISMFENLGYYLESLPIYLSKLLILDSILYKLIAKIKQCNYIDIKETDGILEFKLKKNELYKTGQFYSKNIKHYLKPLRKGIDLYSKDLLSLYQDLWFKIYNNLDKWIDLKDSIVKSNSHPDWMYSNDPEKVPSNLASNTVYYNWNNHKTTQGYNFLTMSHTAILFLHYGTNYWTTLLLLQQELSQMRTSLKFVESSITEKIETLNWSIDIQKKINEDGLSFHDLVSQFKFGDFSILKCPLSRMCMSAMYTAINENNDVQSVINWFKTDGDINSTSPIIDQLGNHPAVDKCGHSGMSIRWTLSQFRIIYRNGWDKWVKDIFSSYGINSDNIINNM